MKTWLIDKLILVFAIFAISFLAIILSVVGLAFYLAVRIGLPLLDRFNPLPSGYVDHLDK